MKYNSYQLVDLMSKIKSGKIKSILLYGPNYGLMHIIMNKIAKMLDFLKISINSKETSISQFYLSANNFNFFNKGNLIKVSNISANLSKQVKNLIENSNNLINFLVFFSTNSLTKSDIKAFFENASNLATVACYYDNEETIRKIIIKICSSYKKSINNNAIEYLTKHLYTDRQVIINEIIKLIYYSHDKEIIRLEDVKNTLSYNFFTYKDELAILLIKAKSKRFIEEVEKLQQQNIDDIFIIRILLKYYVILYIAINYHENGYSIEKSIGLLSTSIFFKHIADFQKILKLVSSTQILKILIILQQAEINYKNNPKTFSFLMNIYLPLLPLINKINYL